MRKGAEFDGLTRRQLDERKYYDDFYPKRVLAKGLEVRFDIISGEKRSHNPYWYTYQCLMESDLTNKRILDVGCGIGDHTIRLAKLGASVVGLDISPVAIKTARHRAKIHDLIENVQFCVGVIEKLNFKDEQFDFVFGIDILHHVEVEPAVREIVRVLRKGGRAYFKEWRYIPFLDTFKRVSLLRKLTGMKTPALFQCTKGEKKLDKHDFLIVTKYFSHVQIAEFGLFTRLAKWISAESELEKIDALFFKLFPVLCKYGDAVVLQCIK